jgi:hypothetical protein
VGVAAVKERVEAAPLPFTALLLRTSKLLE